VAVVVAILVAGFAVRMYKIDTEGLWFDEYSSYVFLDAPSLGKFLNLERTLDAAMVPVYFIAEYFWARLVGDSVLAMRLLSMLAGMTTIFVVYLLGRRMYGHWTGCVAALAVAFSKPLIYQSQEIRMYSFFLLLAAVSSYGFVNAVDSGKKRWWALNCAANALMVSTHLFGALLVATQFAFLLFTRPRSFRLLAIWTGIHAAAESIALGWFLTTDSEALEEHMAWIYTPGLQRLFQAYYYVYAGSKLDALDLVRDLPFRIPVHHLLGISIIGLATIAVLSSLQANGREIAGRSFPMVDNGTLYLLLWLLLPPLALFALTYTVRPCFIERYAMHCSFPLYILAGATVVRLAPSWRAGTTIVLLLIMLGNLMDLTRPMRPDWKSASPVFQRAADDDAIIFTPGWNYQPVIAFYGGLDESRIERSKDFVESAIARYQAGQPAVVALFEVPWVYEAVDIARKLEQEGVPAKMYHYPGRWDVYVWELGTTGDSG